MKRRSRDVGGTQQSDTSKDKPGREVARCHWLTGLLTEAGVECTSEDLFDKPQLTYYKARICEQEAM